MKLSSRGWRKTESAFTTGPEIPLLVRHIIRTCSTLVLLFVVSGASLSHAQTPNDSLERGPGPSLSLNDALRLSEQYNPDFQKLHDAQQAAGASVLAAYGAFLPSVGASMGFGFQEGGNQFFDGTTLGASSNILTSSYGLSFGLSFSGSTFLTPAVARANRDAANADLVGQRQTLHTNVTQQYLTVIEADAKAALQDTLLETAATQLALAQGKAKVGLGTMLDVQQAQVTVGQKKVARLQAYNQSDIERLKLYQQLGISMPTGPRVRLTTTFAVQPLPLSLDSVLRIARQSNPQLTALRLRERTARVNVTLAKSHYLPSVSVGTGMGGYTSEFTNPLIPGPHTFPFGFTQNPFGLSASLSLPIFDNFGREVAVEQAVASRHDAEYDVHARELQLTTDVSSAYLTLQTDGETAEVQAQTADQAHTALTFMQERYKAGLATFVDVANARDTYENAENARISSVYDYFKALADLESAVGLSLSNFGTP